MTDLWDDLLGCLDLLELAPAGEPGTGDGGAERAGADARGAAPAGFEGRNQQLSYHRLFGGQLLAQFVRAASLTSPGKTVKSLHVLFPQEGQSQEPVRYEVERHHEGSTFAALTIRARQAKGVIATASVSLHAPEDGLSQQAIHPVPAVPGAEHRVELGLLPWETRSAADIARDGMLPLNTHGGQLSHGRTHGMGLLAEAIVQLRGEGGPRQVPGARVAVVSSGGLTPSGAILLRTDT